MLFHLSGNLVNEFFNLVVAEVYAMLFEFIFYSIMNFILAFCPIKLNKAIFFFKFFVLIKTSFLIYFKTFINIC